MKSFWDIDLPLLGGQGETIKPLKGKVLLIVNIVSKCGYKPHCSPFWSYARSVRQFRHLQALQNEFGERGFSVVGIPCNQFSRGEMESCNEDEISKFLKEAFPFVNFPISKKIDVNGPARHEIYSFLLGDARRTKSDSPADLSDEAIEGWNRAGEPVSRIPHTWEKFIVSREGHMITRFNWQSMPLDATPLITGESWTIRECIDELL